MKTELIRTLVDLRALATEREWQGLADVADALLSGEPENALLLASSAGSEVGALPRWIVETAPSLHIEKSEIEALASDPLPAATAERMIALFECGKMITTEAVDVVTGICFQRPEGSYAIILRGAEHLQDKDELDLVERNVFRLLAPDPEADWNRQDLLPFNIYLWSDGPAPEFLTERIRRDRDALARWLHHPIVNGDELAARQAVYALDEISSQLSETVSTIPDDSVLTSQRVYAVLEEIAELRRRLLVKLDAEAPSIERQLTASLQTLEQNLLTGVRAGLEARLPHFDPSRDEARVKQAIAEYIAESATRWKEQSEQLMLTRGDQIHSDTDALLHSIDWTVVNAVVPHSESQHGYPEALLDELTDSNELSILHGGAVGSAVTIEADRRKNTFRYVRGLIAVSGIARGAALLGMGPIGLVALGVTVVAGAVKYKADSMDLCEELARKIIHATFRDAIAAVQKQTDDTFRPLRAKLIRQFSALEERLDAALTASHSAPSTTENPDLHQIEEIRRRLVTIATGQDDDNNENAAAPVGTGG